MFAGVMHADRHEPPSITQGRVLGPTWYHHDPWQLGQKHNIVGDGTCKLAFGELLKTRTYQRL